MFVAQAARFPESVEIIVSDNASPDDTEQVVSGFRVCYPGLQIRYSRNPQNLGAARNILKLTDELASGEFAWIFGDDDGIRADALDKILAVISENPQVDVVDLNYSLGDGRDLIDRLDTYPLRKSLHDDWTDTKFETAEELFFSDPEHFSFVSAKVFRLAKWRDVDKTRYYNCDPWSPERWFPQVLILGQAIRTSPAYRIGHPYLIMGGTISWRVEALRVVCFVRPATLQVLANFGFSKNGMRRIIQDHFNRQIAVPMLHGDYPVGDKVLPKGFWLNTLRAYWRFPELYILLAKLAVARVRGIARDIDSQLIGGWVRRLYQRLRKSAGSGV